MKIKIIFLLIAFNLAHFVFAQDSEKWKTVKSTHFIAYYNNADGSFLNKVVEKSEEYYNQIADTLGFRRYNFWLWDNRAKIYIYDNADQYQLATGQPSWSAGAAISKEKIIYTFPNEKGFLQTILPHELGHIIFREFVGFDNYVIPLWLDEGVASYQEAGRRITAEMLVKQAIKDNRLMSLQDLSAFNVLSLKNREAVNIFYAEAFSIVDYLIKKFGSDKFVLFCQVIRDKKNLEEAIRYTYSFNDLKEFDAAWQKYLREN